MLASPPRQIHQLTLILQATLVLGKVLLCLDFRYMALNVIGIRAGLLALVTTFGFDALQMCYAGRPIQGYLH
jgi:hypothetical protein